jgi:queuine tRNA-ribosyltransferase
MRFEVLARDGPARVGRLTTAHGAHETPLFFPVGTYGAVKGVPVDLLRAAGVRALLANALHLALRPGAETLARLGGLHGFMGWDGLLLTDSGGYQVVSLAALRRVTEEGVLFRSPVDGREILWTPERAVAVQEAAGSDLLMVLDDVPAHAAGPDEIVAATERSLRWARRCLEAHGDRPGALLAIVQGGLDAELRRRSARALRALPFAGYALGGLALGESFAERREILALSVPELPEDRPRYLMGVGRPEDIVEAVRHGVDLFDCVIPTRHARNAHLFTNEGVVRLRQARYAEDPRPLDERCRGPCCRRHGRAYLRHLDRLGDPLFVTLASLHNIGYYAALMSALRTAIRDGRLEDFRINEDLASYGVPCDNALP